MIKLRCPNCGGIFNAEGAHYCRPRRHRGDSGIIPVTSMQGASGGNSEAPEPVVEKPRPQKGTYKGRDPVARRKYQREYMRKRRAEGK